MPLLEDSMPTFLDPRFGQPSICHYINVLYEVFIGRGCIFYGCLHDSFDWWLDRWTSKNEQTDYNWMMHVHCNQTLSMFMVCTSMTWWHPAIKTLPALLFLCRLIHWSPVGSPHKGPVMLWFFFVLLTWPNCWTTSWVGFICNVTMLEM